MALETAEITYDMSDLLGQEFWRGSAKASVTVKTNIPTDTIVDTTGNQIRMGGAVQNIGQTGTGTLTVWAPGAGSNPASWQTSFTVSFPDPSARTGRGTRTFGPFTITGDADLADLIAEQEIPPTYLSQVTGALSEFVTDAEAAQAGAATARAGAEAARDQAVDISGISTSDGVIANRIETPGSLTEVALKATIAGEVAPLQAEVDAVPAAIATALTPLETLVETGRLSDAELTDFIDSAVALAIDPSQAILDLATADGWEAVYDPTNAATLTLNGSNVASVADGLGNLPNLAQATSGNQPAHLPGEFGRLAGMDGTSAVKCLRTAALGVPLPQPNTIVIVGKTNTTTGASRYLMDGATSTDRHGITQRLDATSLNPWGLYAGTDEFYMGGPSDTLPHVLAATYDGIYSTLLLDGQMQAAGDAGAQAFGGLTVGERYASSGNHRDGSYGLVLVYAGAIPRAKLNRMLSLIHRATSIAPRTEPGIVAARALTLDDNGADVYAKDADTVTPIASLSKVLAAYVVRQHVTNLAGSTVTIQAGDIIASDIGLAAGDVLTYEQALYAAMLPSSNTAVMALARTIATDFLGGGGVARFMTEMETQAVALGYAGVTVTVNPYGGANMSARQVADLMRAISADAALTAIMGADTHNVAVTGTSPRNIAVTHTIRATSSAPPQFPLPGFVAGKTGSGLGMQHVAVLWDHPEDGTPRISVVLDAPTAKHLLDLRKVIEHAI